MAEREVKFLETTNTKEPWVRMDVQNIKEVIGNLLDDTLKWSNKTVRLTADSTEHGIDF